MSFNSVCRLYSVDYIYLILCMCECQIRTSDKDLFGVMHYFKKSVSWEKKKENIN